MNASCEGAGGARTHEESQAVGVYHASRPWRLGHSFKIASSVVVRFPPVAASSETILAGFTCWTVRIGAESPRQYNSRRIRNVIHHIDAR